MKYTKQFYEILNEHGNEIIQIEKTINNINSGSKIKLMQTLENQQNLLTQLVQVINTLLNEINDKSQKINEFQKSSLQKIKRKEMVSFLSEAISSNHQNKINKDKSLKKRLELYKVSANNSIDKESTKMEIDLNNKKGFNRNFNKKKQNTVYQGFINKTKNNFQKNKTKLEKNNSEHNTLNSYENFASTVSKPYYCLKEESIYNYYNNRGKVNSSTSNKKSRNGQNTFCDRHNQSVQYANTKPLNTSLYQNEKNNGDFNLLVETKVNPMISDSFCRTIINYYKDNNNNKISKINKKSKHVLNRDIITPTKMTEKVFKSSCTIVNNYNLKKTRYSCHNLRIKK